MSNEKLSAILDFPFDKDGHLTIDDFHILAEQARELEAEVEVLQQKVSHMTGELDTDSPMLYGIMRERFSPEEIVIKIRAARKASDE